MKWIFGSLLAPVTPLHPATAESIASHLTVADWSLRRGEHLVLPADSGRGRKELVWRGSIGTISYRLAGSDTVIGSARASLDTLVRFSTYAGCG
jgi:hypothetical protein